MPTLTNRWAVLALLFFVRLIFPIHFQSLPPLTVPMMADLGMNFTRVGMLIGAFMLPGIALSLPSGLLGVRFGDKRVVLAGLVLMIVGVELVAVSPSFAPAFLGRLLSGAGSVLLNVQIAKIITDWFAGRELSTAMGLHLTAYPLGIALALSVLGAVAEWSSWRMAMHLIGLLTVVSLLLMALLYHDPPAEEAEPATGGRVVLWRITPIEIWLIVSASLIWNVFNAAYVIFLGFAPTLLVARGMGIVAAGFLVGVASWVTIPTGPIGGYLADRSSRNLWIILGALGSALSIMLIVAGQTPLLWILALGLAFGLPPGAIMALPAEVLRPSSRGTGFGIFYTSFFIGMTLLPPVAGWLQDRTGDAGYALGFAAALMLLTVPALLLFRALQRRLPLTPPAPVAGLASMTPPPLAQVREQARRGVTLLLRARRAGDG